MSLLPRFARPSDVPRVLPLLSQDRVLFRSDTWAKLPDILAGQIERRILYPAMIEDLETGRPVFFGVTAWARPASVSAMLSKGPDLFRDAVMRAEIGGQRVLLRPGELRAANSSGDLALLHLAGCPESPDFNQVRAQEVHRLALQFFVQVHAGYRIAEFWQEHHLPEACLLLKSMGMTEVRQIPLKSGLAARLFRFTREEALATPGTQLAYMMRYRQPGLGFSPAQQRLLELVLLDYSDADAAEQLGISVEAVRKRWRSIHSRHSFGEGRDQRRPLLAYLRHHPEELRPWKDPLKATHSRPA